MNEPVLYSSILQDFARPLLNEKDTDEIFIKKMKIIKIIWNYCIAKEFKLPVFSELEKIIKSQNQLHPSMKHVFDEFVRYKKTDFEKYKNFIVGIELRINGKGKKTLYVESVHPQSIKKQNNHV